MENFDKNLRQFTQFNCWHSSLKILFDFISNPLQNYCVQIYNTNNNVKCYSFHWPRGFISVTWIGAHYFSLTVASTFLCFHLSPKWNYSCHKIVHFAMYFLHFASENDFEWHEETTEYKKKTRTDFINSQTNFMCTEKSFCSFFEFDFNICMCMLRRFDSTISISLLNLLVNSCNVVQFTILS